MTVRVYAIFAAVMRWAAPSIAQQRFDFAEAAAQAIIDAAESHDSARLSAILGPNAGGILTSGDAAQDREEQAGFARMARLRHRLEISPMNSNRVILAIGDEDWPFPVPIRRIDGKWSFDSSEAPAEMRARRIGSDALDAIEICHGYVDAQRKFASPDRARGGMIEYAPHLLSRTGVNDGLYRDGSDEQLIPAGFAHAERDGIRSAQAKPYHGYYFRVLDGQGPNAPGGAHSYLVKGKLIGGFALVAWPASYGVTGIHTFIVNQNGLVYQKDIAPASGRPYPPVAGFDPDHSWEPVE